MQTVELKVPSVGESITEVLISRWLVAAGGAVQQDEPVVVLETDKVTVDLPAPADGELAEILKQEGETAKVGEAIARIAVGAAPARAAAPAAAPAARAAAAAPGPVMPAAARLLAERGLQAEHVAASGPGGRLLKEDVLRHAEAPPATPRPATPRPATPRPAAPPPAPEARHEEIVPMTPLRKRVAERLVQAQHGAALLTTFNEIDMSQVMRLRREHQDAFREKHGVKLGFMSFFVKAVIEALKLIPELNAEIRGENVLYRNYYDIGIAVGGGRGLVVPVIRGAERLGFAQLEAAIADFAARARESKLTLEELQGGTFTISNGGVYGSLLSTPIINPPQSGVLGLHAVQERPVVRDGQIVARPMMYVALTYDHRIVDGREAVTFLKHVKQCLEEPARILLEV